MQRLASERFIDDPRVDANASITLCPLVDRTASPEVCMPPTDLPRSIMNQAEERLYSVWAVVLATFLGSPVAGGVLLSINCHRLSEPSVIPHILMWTGLLTVGPLLLGDIIPPEQRMVEALLVAVQVLIMYFLASRLQAKAIALHLQRGGEIASYWGAIGIGVTCGLILLWLLVGLGLTPVPSGNDGESLRALG